MTVNVQVPIIIISTCQIDAWELNISLNIHDYIMESLSMQAWQLDTISLLEFFLLEISPQSFVVLYFLYVAC